MSTPYQTLSRIYSILAPLKVCFFGRNFYDEMLLESTFREMVYHQAHPPGFVLWQFYGCMFSEAFIEKRRKKTSDIQILYSINFQQKFARIVNT